MELQGGHVPLIPMSPLCLYSVTPPHLPHLLCPDNDLFARVVDESLHQIENGGPASLPLKEACVACSWGWAEGRVGRAQGWGETAPSTAGIADPSRRIF